MGWIMQLIGGVEGIERAPELAELIGGYVTRYEPENAPKGEQWIWVSDDPADALTFEDAAELHKCYAQSIGTRPWDGKPDRPITVFHIQATQREVHV